MRNPLKEEINKKLMAEYPQLFSKQIVKKEEARAAATQALHAIMSLEKVTLPEPEQEKIINEIVEEFAGLGPIEDLLDDSEITEIMINGPKKVYIEKHGKKVLTDITFQDEQQLRRLIYTILAPTRRRVDELFPYVDVSLKDGSRVNIVIEPLAIDGSVVTIRKFLKVIRDAEDLILMGTLDRRMADFLIACIKAKVNILFSGATGAGKTTTLNALSSYIPNDERIVTIEDTAELMLNQEHWVRLEARQSNIEGRGEITIRDLFRNCLRMRPERIILGEIRGAEALDMLQAICSGHNGSLTILHASSPLDVVYRLETMILTSGVPVSLDVIHRQIAAAVNIIVQQEQLVDGSRRITHISQVNGIKDQRVVLEDLFVFENEGVDSQGKVKGKWVATGVMPASAAMFQKAGVDLPAHLFSKG